MGLDNFIILDDEKLYPVLKKKLGSLHLVRGMMFGQEHWIRGKIYNELVEAITGESLYQEEISAERVKQMYEKLKKTKFTQIKHLLHWFEDDEREQAWKNLLKFFEVAVKFNGRLGGWW